jgi:hypothetical protein
MGVKRVCKCSRCKQKIKGEPSYRNAKPLCKFCFIVYKPGKSLSLNQMENNANIRGDIKRLNQLDDIRKKRNKFLQLKRMGVELDKIKCV